MCGLCVLFGATIMWGISMLMDAAVLRHDLAMEYGNRKLLAEVDWGIYSILCLAIFAAAIQIPIENPDSKIHWMSPEY